MLIVVYVESLIVFVFFILLNSILNIFIEGLLFYRVLFKQFFLVN